jgi:hypothetical protein
VGKEEVLWKVWRVFRRGKGARGVLVAVEIKKFVY